MRRSMAAFLLAAMTGACGVLDGNNGESCQVLADAHWSPENYLRWRTSTISRRSSITHALPCSAYVVTGNFADCGGREKQQYYEVLGKYDQFVAGWYDVKDSVGNPVEPTDIDSVENFHSALRLQYEDCRH